MIYLESLFAYYRNGSGIILNTLTYEHFGSKLLSKDPQ